MTAPVIPDAALEADIAILGKKGRGKTYAAKGLVERLLAMGRRVVVLDPLSTWWGLKAGPNGFVIPVLGGPHGDLPLRDTDGKALGQHLAGADTSAVLDLGAMRKAELVRFATPFLEELYIANRRPLTLVLEEADVFAPQQPMNDATRLLGEVDRIARRGRQYGFRLISLTQRPAKLNKDVLTQLSTLIVLGITAPQDREAIGAWVEGNADRDAAKAVIGSLAALKVGEGWVWAPDLDLLERTTFPPIRTPDTSATPKAGDAPIAAPAPIGIDLTALRAALAPAPDAKSTRKLAADVDNDALDAARQQAFSEGLAEGVRQGEAQGRAAAVAQLDDLWPGLRAAIAGGEPSWHPNAEGTPGPSPLRPRAEPAKRRGEAAPSGAIGLSPTARRILDVLEGIHPLHLTFKAAAIRAGASPRSSQFRAYRRELLESGSVEEVGDRLCARRAHPEKRITGAQAVREIAGKLPPSQAAMLQRIAMTRGPLDRGQIADGAEVSRTSSGLGQGLRELVAMELIEKLPDGRFRLSSALRDEGENT